MHAVIFRCDRGHFLRRLIARRLTLLSTSLQKTKHKRETQTLGSYKNLVLSDRTGCYHVVKACVSSRYDQGTESIIVVVSQWAYLQSIYPCAIFLFRLWTLWLKGKRRSADFYRWCIGILAILSTIPMQWDSTLPEVSSLQTTGSCGCAHNVVGQSPKGLQLFKIYSDFMVKHAQVKLLSDNCVQILM